MSGSLYHYIYVHQLQTETWRYDFSALADFHEKKQTASLVMTSTRLATFADVTKLKLFFFSLMRWDWINFWQVPFSLSDIAASSFVTDRMLLSLQISVH